MLYSSTEFHFPIKKLKSLNLQGSTLLHSCAFSMMVTGMKDHLTELSLAHTDIENWKLHVLKDMIHIERLNLNAVPVTKQSTCTEAPALSSMHTTCTLCCVALLECACKMKKLTYLSLKACQHIDDVCLESLVDLLSNVLASWMCESRQWLFRV